MASSREEQRKQKIPKGSYLQEGAVNLWGIGESPSGTTQRTNQDHLMEQVVNRENMLMACTVSRGAAGVDGMEIKSLRPFLLDNWTHIRNQLLNGTYQPKPVRRVRNPETRRRNTVARNSNGAGPLDPAGSSTSLNPDFDPTF
jgi:RNA-directed DNA polymerase